MATGAVSSSGAIAAPLADAVAAAKARVAAQQAEAAAAGQVIQSGVTVTTSLNALTNGKTYFHRIPGARTILPDGREIQFLGGQFSTAEPMIIAELDAVADSNTSMIYTDRSRVESAKAAENTLAAQAADTVGDNKI